MKYYRLKYKNGTEEVVKGSDMGDVIRKYKLTAKKHIHTRIFELKDGEFKYNIASYKYTNRRKDKPISKTRK